MISLLFSPGGPCRDGVYLDKKATQDFVLG